MLSIQDLTSLIAAIMRLYNYLQKGIFIMAKKQKTQEKKVPEVIYHPLDKSLIIFKLGSLAEEAGDIAAYIDETVQYGRALGYAEGRQAAYSDFSSRIAYGEFDTFVGEDGSDGHEM
jgi:hypothetical protein